MPAAVPFIPQIISGGSAVLGSLLGKKKSAAGAAAAKPYTPNPAYTKPMADFAGAVLPQAQQGFQKSMDYYGNVLANPEQATASDAASVGRQTQQLTQRAARTMPRGGAQAQIVGQIPQQQMAAGLDRRITAQMGAAGGLSDVASRAGGLGTNIFGNLLGNELGGHQANLQGGYLDLANRREDRDYYGGIGGSIFDILNSKSGGGTGGSIMDKIMGGLGKNTGGGIWDEKIPGGGSSTSLGGGWYGIR